MIGKKKLSEIKAEVSALLRRLPGSPKTWLEEEVRSARKQRTRDVETLEMLCAALESEAKRAGSRRVKANSPKA